MNKTATINWKLLFRMTKDRYGGKVPEYDFVPSEEDNEWIKEQMNKYTFEETDRMKEMCDKIVEQAELVWETLWIDYHSKNPLNDDTRFAGTPWSTMKKNGFMDEKYKKLPSYKYFTEQCGRDVKAEELGIIEDLRNAQKAQDKAQRNEGNSQPLKPAKLDRTIQVEKMKPEEFSECFEEITEMVELAPRNSMNLCLMGGLTALLCLIVALDKEEDHKTRRSACLLVSSSMSSNKEVQEFAAKAGAVNLSGMLDRDEKPEMTEAILGGLSAFLKAANFTGKRQYITIVDGLGQLTKLTCLKHLEETKKFGEKQILRKIRLKLIQLIYDLVLNDESIIGNGFHVRDELSGNKKLVQNLLDTLIYAKLELAPEAQRREYTLNILLRLYQRRPALKTKLDPTLKAHIDAIDAAIPVYEDRKESLDNEKELAEKVLQADKNSNVVKNFAEIKAGDETVTIKRDKTSCCTIM